MTDHLQRLRCAVRGVLVLGLAASVVANVLHADPNPISKVIAGWPPVALWLAIELVIHVPVHRLAVTRLRRGGTLLIAGIAAYVSYWHMAGVAARYGESGLSVYLLPLSVDGLIAVASICLVEITGRLGAENTAPALTMDIQKATIDAQTIEPAPDVEPVRDGHDRAPAVAAPKPVRDKPQKQRGQYVSESARAAADRLGTRDIAAVLAEVKRTTHKDATPEAVRRALSPSRFPTNGHTHVNA